MLSDQIITFATLLNAAILLATLLAGRKMNSSRTMQGYGTSGKMSDIIGFPDFVLPGLPPVLPAEAENVGNSEIVTATPAQATAIHPGRTASRVMRARGFAVPETTQKTCLHPAQAADLLIATMNAEGQTGLFTASEIDRWWEIVVALEDIEEMPAQFVRSAMARHHVGQRRLNTPEYRHIRQRSGQSRANLYRIPKCRVLSGDQPVGSEHSPALTAGGSGMAPVKTPDGKTAARHSASQNRAKTPVNADIFAEAA